MGTGTEQYRALASVEELQCVQVAPKSLTVTHCTFITFTYCCLSTTDLGPVQFRVVSYIPAPYPGRQAAEGPISLESVPHGLLGHSLQAPSSRCRIQEAFRQFRALLRHAQARAPSTDASSLFLVILVPSSSHGKAVQMLPSSTRRRACPLAGPPGWALQRWRPCSYSHPASGEDLGAREFRFSPSSLPKRSLPQQYCQKTAAKIFSRSRCREWLSGGSSPEGPV